MTSVFRWDPFAEMRSSMESLFDQGFSRPWRMINTDYNSFPLDFWETNDSLEVRAAIPGIAPEDVSISLTGDALTIKCEHRPASEADRRYYIREMNTGSYQRSISLHTTVDPDKAEARHENGVLHLSMPKAESARVRQIHLSPQDKNLLN